MSGALAAAPASRAQHGRGQNKPSICVLALSPIADDPRVRRQADAFFDAGWDVTAVGLPGGRSPAPRWPILTRDDLVSPPATASGGPNAAVPESRKRRILRRFRRAQRFLPVGQRNWDRVERLLKFLWARGDFVLGFGSASLRSAANRLWGRTGMAGRPLSGKVAEERFWSMSSNIHDMYDCAQHVEAQIWLANDWTALPIAARLAREKGGVYGYDTHEFATEEYAESLSWRLLQRPFVLALERLFVPGAIVISAVSAGIAERLDQLYELTRPSLVIRNMPAFEQVAFRATAPERIRVLYHGLVSPNRGIEAAIDSVAAWRPEFTLTIRGPGEAAYLDELNDRINKRGLSERVELAPPVPMTALVREATAFDVGFFALPGHSPHNQFALPNKFFEYTMAGLALCMTDLPEMARLIQQHKLGITFAEVEPATIAGAINALTADQIDRCKRNALAAARELCWDREAERLVNAYRAAAARALTEG